jgi:hypothetical protein
MQLNQEAKWRLDKKTGRDGQNLRVCRMVATGRLRKLNLKGSDNGVQCSESLCFWMLCIIWNFNELEKTFWKLDLFPSSGERKETPTLLGPLERAGDQ